MHGRSVTMCRGFREGRCSPREPSRGEGCLRPRSAVGSQHAYAAAVRQSERTPTKVPEVVLTMCGIAGILRAGHVAGVGPAQSVEAQRHRGPDDEGLVMMPTGAGGPELCLGHRRLAILDPSPAGTSR